MKLENKKELVSRTLKVGLNRVVFNTARLNEIKEAITKQDVRDLFVSGAIMVKEIKGTKTKEKRKWRRRSGSIRMSPKGGKTKYVMRTRKLRDYIMRLRDNEMISRDIYLKLRQEIRASVFKDLTHLKERIEVLKHA
jgi:large subunit ribosomal protein L19e